MRKPPLVKIHHIKGGFRPQEDGGIREGRDARQREVQGNGLDVYKRQLEGLSQLINTVKLVKQHLNGALEVEGVVLTMFDARTNLSIQVVEEVKKFFRGKVHRVIIPRNVRLGEAPSHGLPITRYDAKCIGSEAYTELAREIMGIEED